MDANHKIMEAKVDTTMNAVQERMKTTRSHSESQPRKYWSLNNSIWPKLE
jgi:hypothetical protein